MGRNWSYLGPPPRGRDPFGEVLEAEGVGDDVGVRPSVKEGTSYYIIYTHYQPTTTNDTTSLTYLY